MVANAKKFAKTFDDSKFTVIRRKDSFQRKDNIAGFRTSLEHYHALFESTNNPLLLIDNSFNFIDCNKATVKILGGESKNDIIGMPPASLSPKYQPDGQLSTVKAEKMIKRAYKNGQHQFEWVHKRLDGVHLCIKVNLTVVAMEEEKILLVNWQNITENKKAEETINKLYQAIEQTNEIVFMTDIDGTIKFLNTAFEEVYGYKKEEVVGKLTPRILKSGLMKKTFYKDLWDKLPAGKGLQKEIINKTKDGRLINIHTSLSPIFSNEKKLIGYMCVQIDITEKKIAEKKIIDAELQYRTIFEQSPDGISLIDFETLLPLDFNQKAHEQLGYSREEFSQLQISDYEVIDTPEVIKSRGKKIMKEGHDDFITRHKTKNGEIRDIHVIVQRIMLHDKPVFYAIFRDITDKIKLEKALKQQEIDQQRQIMEATISGQEKEKNELGIELHDNINQLLATAKMYLGMVKANQDFPENMDLIGKSYDYVNDALGGIRKLTHSLVAPTLGDKSLQESLKEFIQEVNSTHAIEVKLVDEMNKGQMKDKKKELMIYRIVQEQMNNIHKHAHAKTIIIHLKAKEGCLNLSIADNGVGFDTLKKDNGIGLRNIRSRVEFYSGNMNIISSLGKGCRLEVTIPM
jgi:PAS domain S-box-containing protein